MFTAEYMMYLGVWAGGVGNVGLCSTIACQIDERVGACGNELHAQCLLL